METDLSRRDLLKNGVAMAAGGVAAAGGAILAAPADAQVSASPTPPRPYRAWIRHGTTGGVQTVRPRAISGRQVLVRVEYCQADYSQVGIVLGSANRALPQIPGDSSIGRVEAIGADVRSLQVGDRVIIAVKSQCGRCHQCLRGRSDRCATTEGVRAVEVADLADGTPVTQQSSGGGKGGLAEVAIVYEDACVPVFSEVPSDQLAMLCCTGTTGLALAMTARPIDAGADVVVFGAGPVGLSAVQGARIQGANQIIVVEPIAARRQLALKLGATAAVDPNVDTATLLERLREMCKGPTDRIFAGGKGGGANRGPDFVIEAVGADYAPPKAEAGPDPTGILPLQQVWDLCPGGGHIVTSGVGYPQGAMLSLSPGQFTNGAKTIQGGQYGAAQSLRDVRRNIKLIEKGLFDAKSMISAVYPLDKVRDAHQAVVDRTVISALVSCQT